MSKVKSAIITAILLAAIIVAALFAVISFPVAGSDGVKRIDSIASRISLGGEFTGEAYTVLYPEGVISAARYRDGMPEDPAQGDADYDEKKKNREEYIGKYINRGSVYVAADLIAVEDGEGGFEKDADGNIAIDVKKDAELKAAVGKDAEIISDRLEAKDIFSCTVSVEDDYGIRVAVPTGFNYSAYRDDGYSDGTSSGEISRVSALIQYVSLSGGVTLRNPNETSGLKQIFDPDMDVADYFKSISAYSRGGVYALRFKLTDTGYDRLSSYALDLAEADTKSIYIYIGETPLLNIPVDSGIPGKTMYLTVSSNSSISDKEAAENYAALLNSALKGNALENEYIEYLSDTNSTWELRYTGSQLGRHAVIYTAAVLLAVVLIAAFLPVIRYKKLGLVNAMTTVLFALVLLYAIYLLGVTFTLAGAFAAIFGLALFGFSNFRVYEAVRKETEKGKTIQSAVKAGYRAQLAGILDVHILLLLISVIIALVPVSGAAACGIIIFISVIASYALHWITRFMWYVVSAPSRDKFGFAGFAREDDDDDE